MGPFFSTATKGKSPNQSLAEALQQLKEDADVGSLIRIMIIMFDWK
jgi:hypothetical protein